MLTEMTLDDGQGRRRADAREGLGDLAQVEDLAALVAQCGAQAMSRVIIQNRTEKSLVSQFTRPPRQAEQRADLGQAEEFPHLGRNRRHPQRVPAGGELPAHSSSTARPELSR